MAEPTTSEAVMEAMKKRAEDALADLWPDWGKLGQDAKTVSTAFDAARISVAIDALQEIADRHLNAEPNHPDRFIALEALAALTGGPE